MPRTLRCVSPLCSVQTLCTYWVIAFRPSSAEAPATSPRWSSAVASPTRPLERWVLTSALAMTTADRSRSTRLLAAGTAQGAQGVLAEVLDDQLAPHGRAPHAREVRVQRLAELRIALAYRPGGASD